MAISGQKITAKVRKRIVHLLTLGSSRRQIVKACKVCKRTVDKIAREELRKAYETPGGPGAATRSASEEMMPQLIADGTSPL